MLRTTIRLTFLPFIVMEFVEGRVLTALIPADGLPIQTVVQLGIQIAGAIAHAHGQGIIHRDLKPGNVAVTPDGRVKILDFGVAARLPRPTQPDETGEATRTADAAFAGTTAYMAPEALRGEPPRESSDIWALGILLHEMATGRRPFRGESASELVSAITRDPVTPPRGIHSGLRRIILRCLVKDPAQRYASAAEVRSALETITDSLEQEAEEKPLAPPLRSPERSSYLWAAGAVMLVTVALALWWGTGRRSEVGPSNFRLLSTFPGAHHSATLSPDGGMVAFVDVSQDVPQVWVKNLAEGDPIQITSGDVAAQRPRWSPTSDRIVFGRRGGGIWEVSSLGGPERQLVTNGASPHLSADGRLMVFERDGEIWIAGPDGSSERRVEGTPRRGYSVDLAPVLSPDGTLIAFFVSELGPNGDFWVIPSTGGEARRLTHDVTEGGSPAWTPDGHRIVFSSARAGSHTLWSISLDGGEPVALTTGAGEDRDPILSSDGRTLVYTNVRNSWSLMLKDPMTGSQRQLIQRRAGILWPMISPDGSRIAYFGPDGLGNAHVFAVDVQSLEVRQITRNQGDATEINTMPRWGGDPDHLYYYRQRPQNSFRRMPVVGGQSTEVAPWTWEVQFGAAVHPIDGRVAYVRRAKGQPWVTRVIDPAGGSEIELPQLLLDPSWSADGRFLLGARQNQVYRCDAETLLTCTAVTSGSKPHLPGDGTRLYFFRPGPSPLQREVWVRELASGAEQPLQVVGPFRAIDVHFDVSAAGEIVWAQLKEGSHELWMAEMR